MRIKEVICFITLALSLGLLSVNAAWGQVSPQRLDAIRKLGDRINAISDQIPENARKALSGGAQNLINLAERFDRIEPLLLEENTGGAVLPLSQILAPTIVSNPGGDTANLSITRLAGFTQSETHAACGVVITQLSDITTPGAFLR